MNVRNFSKLIQKTICRQSIQMPKFVPFRNFGVVNPSERFADVNKKPESKESKTFNEQDENMRNIFQQGQLRGEGELKKAMESRQGEQLEMPKQEKDKIVFDNEGTKSGIENPTDTNKERVFDNERNFDKEKVFDTNLRSGNENQRWSDSSKDSQKWQERGQENQKWAEKGQQKERGFEKSENYKNDMKNQQILGTGFEDSSMRKQAKGGDAKKERAVIQNTGGEHNPKYFEDSKIVFKQDEIDPEHSDSKSKKIEDIVSNQFSSERPDQSFKTQSIPDQSFNLNASKNVFNQQSDLSYKKTEADHQRKAQDNQYSRNVDEQQSQQNDKVQQLQQKTEKDQKECEDLCKQYPNKSVEEIIQLLHKEMV